MMLDRNDAPEHTRGGYSESEPHVGLHSPAPGEEVSHGLQAAPEKDWPRPYAEIGLPHWEDSMDLERLHTAVEVRIAELASLDPGAPDGGYLLGITSAVAGEGKTTVAMALAATVARNSEQRVCLVDLGLAESNPWQNSRLPMGKSGLLDVLEGRTLEPDTVRVSDHPEFVIVPAGRHTRHPAKMARSPRLPAFLDLARRHFDLVIVDLPAVASNNVQPIARYLDSLVLVACAGVTPKQLTRQALGTLDTSKMLGIVLNRMQPLQARKLLKRS